MNPGAPGTGHPRLKPASRTPLQSTPCAQTRQAGFTLLEVLVALAILSVAVVTIIQGFAQGLRLLKLSGDHQQAILLADSKLREVVEPEERREQGDEGVFQWERTTTLLETPDLRPAGAPPRWRVYQIAVRVTWDERRQVEVASLRTVPATPTTTRPGAPPPRDVLGRTP
ncbi:MAG: type IV pilus modification PilV family protein [Candidatus Rokuibacteriota bacterium]